MKVSIIVAAYNEEKLIHRCLDSLIEQSLNADFEVIVVDDGSTDSTLSICKDYEYKFPNVFKVIHKDNGGQGLARNDGIKISTGEYIGFVDADDWVDREMFKVMYETAIKNDSDLVVCDVHKIYEGIDNDTFQHSLPFSQDNVSIASYLKDGIDNAYSCNKLFKRKIWENFQFKNMVYEDLEVILPIVSYSKVLSYVQKSFYHYFKHKGSTTTTYENPRLFDILFAYKSAIESSNQRYVDEVAYCVAKRILINLETDGFKYYKADFINLIQDLQKYFDNNDLIKKNEKIRQIYRQYSKRVLPNNIVISASNKAIQFWKLYSNRAKIITFENHTIEYTDESLNQLGSVKKTEEDYNKIKLLYENGGILVDNCKILKSPIGGLRNFENFLIKDEYGNIDCELVGFQKKHKFLFEVLCFYKYNDDIEDISLSQVIRELLDKDKEKNSWNDIKVISYSKLNEIVLFSQ